MTWEFAAGLVIAFLLMMVGLVGSILPGLPGTPMVFGVAMLHRLYYGDRGSSAYALILLGIIMLVSIAIDFLAGVVGAKKLGATWRGMVGAGVGAFLGIFAGPAGVLIGPFLGAFAGEMMGGRLAAEAGRAGLGATLGLLGGVLGKVICCLMMIGVFFVDLIWRQWRGG